MSYWSSKVSDVHGRLTDTLRYSTEGNSVTDLALDLLNRAQAWLWQYRDWSMLTRHATLTIAADNSATLPTDCGRIVSVFYDQANDLNPTWIFFQDHQDRTKRYTLSDEFDKTTGHVQKIVFPSAPTQTVKIRYIKTLDDMTATTDYLFFPAELMLRCAQKINREEIALSGTDFDAIVNSFQEELRNFEEAVQNRNIAGQRPIADALGYPVFMDEVNSSGSTYGSYQASPRRNSERWNGI